MLLLRSRICRRYYIEPTFSGTALLQTAGSGHGVMVWPSGTLFQRLSARLPQPCPARRSASLHSRLAVACPWPRHVEDKINAEAVKESIGIYLRKNNAEGIQGIYWSFLKFVNSVEVCTPMPRRNWNNTHRIQSQNTLIHLQSKARTRDDPCLVCRVSWRVVVRSAFERRTMSCCKHVFVQQQLRRALKFHTQH